MKLNDAIELIDYPLIHSNDVCVWADLGAGSGLFSFALGSLLPHGSVIYAVDKFPQTLKGKLPRGNSIISVTCDLEKQAPALPKLNGILAANTLHFIQDKQKCLMNLHSLLKPDGVYIIVEYDTENATRWIPYPLPLSALADLFKPFGFNTVKQIGRIKSKFNPSFIYSAIITK